MQTEFEKERSSNLRDLKKQIEDVFAAQQSNRWNIGQSTAKERIVKLKRIHTWICDNKKHIREALYADFGRAEAEVDALDLYPSIIEIKHAIRNLKKWMKPRAVRPTIALLTTRSHIRYEPKGVVLIISPWNFPFMLAVSPLVSAVAAGNCIVLKPSELSPHTSHVIRELVNDSFSAHEVAVFEGDKHVAIELLKKPFNHIMFTGSSDIGENIMRAAAKNLSSVTLELGGKNPVIIDSSADIKDAAKKISWGRFTNTGQTCLAPDYIFVHETKFDQFLNLIKGKLQSFYGESESDRQKSEDFGRIIDQKHYERLKSMITDAAINGAKIEMGGISSPDDRYISPTIITNVNIDSRIMEEEIFGPILPIIKYESLDQVLQLIKVKEIPLSLYIFSRNKKNIEKIIAQIPSGNVGINEVVVQFIQYNLPFGGLNHSGIGSTHGVFGFRAFSHERAILRNSSFSLIKLIYPPYTKKNRKIIDLMIRYFS